MSRGWESKSVESQQAEQTLRAEGVQERSVAAGSQALAADEKRQRQALEMQRERILSERTSSPHRRSALELALADVEEKLGELGWSIHL